MELELLFAVLEGVRRQLQTGDPTFRPLFQGSDPLRGEVQAHRTSEEIRRLLVGEAQVGGADLGHLSRARSLGSGSGGLVRPAMTRCIGGGQWSSRKARASWMVSELREW